MSTWKRANQLAGSTTPNVEISAGVRPAQHYKVASYLPKVRLDKKTGAYKVISAGKVIATDSNNYVVPAGLALDIEQALTSSTKYNSKAEFITEKADFKTLYTSIDVAEGVKNFQGDDVTVDEPVVASFFTDYDSTKAALNTVGNALGIAPYDAWEQDGSGYGDNPVNYDFVNWKMQTGLAILTRYFIELPVVANTSGLVFPGLAVFTGTPVQGGLVTYDAESNMIPYAAPSTVADIALDTTDTYADADVNTAVNAAIANINTAVSVAAKGLSRVLGKVYFVDTTFPKDYLNYVRTWNPGIAGSTALDKAPGSATSGLPDNLSYAGVTDPSSAKLVRINLLV